MKGAHMMHLTNLLFLRVSVHENKPLQILTFDLHAKIFINSSGRFSSTFFNIMLCH